MRSISNTLLIGTLVLHGCTISKIHHCSHEEISTGHYLLYFGAQKPSGYVTTDEWKKFLETVVTPFFPEGLTAWQAYGQWKSKSNEIIQERSYVLSLAYKRSKGTDEKIHKIIEKYKSLHDQEDVLVIRAPVCMYAKDN
jgi:Protein of unknown function (DUF3574).